MLVCAVEIDVVFTSIASEALLFMKESVKDLPAVCQYVGKLRMFVDIVVPKNIDACGSYPETAWVYNIDDLKEVAAANERDQL